MLPTHYDTGYDGVRFAKRARDAMAPVEIRESYQHRKIRTCAAFDRLTGHCSKCCWCCASEHGRVVRVAEESPDRLVAGVRPCQVGVSGAITRMSNWRLNLSQTCIVPS